MGLIDDLLAALPVDEVPVRDVRVGAHWTAVCSRGCGLAATFLGDHPHGSRRVRDVGCLHLKSAQELAGWLRSDHPLEASIGLAAYNSLVSVDMSRAVEINAFDWLERRAAGKKIAVVGHFPQVERLAGTATALWVLEKRPQPGDYPAEAAPELIPRADIVAITGSTLINHTLEGLLELCSPGALVMLLGPSTPLVPLLFERGVNLLSGTLIFDEAAALLTIQQGAAFPQVQGARRITLSREGSLLSEG
jgi:uncharacterized protein (DUF4213/DUF364 family)